MTTFEGLIELIFPKKCINCKKFGEFICADCFARISYNSTYQCSVCFRPAINGMTHPVCSKTKGLDGVIPVVVYNGIVKKLIYQFKYAPNLHKLDSTIGEIMVEGLSQNESFYSYIERFKPVLVPIPLSAARFRARGYNHAELLTYYVAQYFKLKVRSNVLIRVKDTKPQYKLNKEARIKNLANAFAVSGSINKKNIPESIILIDDITTSFSTLKEAAKVLKKSGVKRVLGVTFAKEA